MKYRYNSFNHHPFHTHTMAFDLIDSGSKVLDIGCATGFFAKQLLKKDCEVWGVDGDENAVLKARDYCKKAIPRNLETIKSLPFPKRYFDYVVLMDVIEHLNHTELILKIVKQHLKKDGNVIVSVPNIAHASIRWMLLRGEFQYTTKGIMDKTHLHFYTMNSFRNTLKENGFKVLKMLPTNGMTKVPLLRKFTDRLPATWQYRIACMAPTLFSYQFMALVKIR